MIAAAGNELRECERQNQRPGGNSLPGGRGRPCFLSVELLRHRTE
jgi:hypothetical protein